MKVFGFAGWSGAGKTTLIERVIPRLVSRRLRVSVVKHAHHAFDIDRPGKDSWRHRAAGAHEVLLASEHRWALMHELRSDPEPTLSDLLERLSGCDLALVEGFKRAPIAKLEVHRPALGKPLLFPHDPHVVALACDAPVATALPRFHPDDVDAIVGFVVDHLGLEGEGHEPRVAAG